MRLVDQALVVKQGTLGESRRAGRVLDLDGIKG